MPVKPVPDDYRKVTPMLVVDDATRLIDFIKKAFGAEERLRIPMPDNKIGHCELTLGDSVIMVADGSPQFPAVGKGDLHLFVEDCDATYRTAVAAGGVSEMEPADQFYGDRSAVVRDPLGNRWSIATHVEDVSTEETMRRMSAMMGGAHP
jgi:PhnB protein